MAMYVLPKALESIWVTARGKGWVFRTGRWGNVILAALGMAMVMVNGIQGDGVSKVKLPQAAFLYYHIFFHQTSPRLLRLLKALLLPMA